MRLKSLCLHHFRLFEHSIIHFDEGINHFTGDNASGKTTILEALYFLSTGKSLRTHHLQEIIQEGSDHFALELHFSRHLIDQTLQVIYEPHQIRIVLNDTKIPSLHGLLGLIQGVVIAADDVQVIKKGPQERREMLDLFLLSLDPLYHHHIQRYKKALKHRNALLKMRSLNTLGAFEEQLAISGCYILQQRNKACQNLQDKAATILQELTDKSDALQIEYITQIDPTLEIENLREQLLTKYFESREKDCEQFVTSIGPHRDDILFYINGKQAKLYASEGQQRTLCNALKMAQYQLFTLNQEENAFLCIDDLKMSLDASRKNLLLQTLKKYNQVFLTSPDKIDDLAECGKLFLCKEARIQEISSKQKVS